MAPLDSLTRGRYSAAANTVPIPRIDPRAARRHSICLVFIALSVGLFFTAVLADARAAEPSASDRIKLTDAERGWLQAHPRIRVHNETNWPPFNFVENGQPRGYSIDFMNLVARNVGLQVDYVTGPSWNDFIEMMKRGELDVMLNIVRTPEREKFLLFTQPYARNPNTLVSPRSTPYRRLDQLAGKTVAVPQGFFYEEVLRRDYPRIKILPVTDVLTAMQAVSQGDADATLGELAVLDYFIDHLKTEGLTASGDLAIGDPDLTLARMATRQDEPLLASILGKGIASVTSEERQALERKWLGDNKAFEVPWPLANLSDDDVTWLSQHRDIRLGIDPSYPPFEFVDNKGAFAGIASDYAALIAKVSALR